MNEYFSNEWRNFSPTDVYIKKNKKDKMLIIHKSVKNYIKGETTDEGNKDYLVHYFKSALVNLFHLSTSPCQLVHNFLFCS